MEKQKKNKIKLGFIIIGILFIIPFIGNFVMGIFNWRTILSEFTPALLFLYLGFKPDIKKSKKEIQEHNKFIRIEGFIFGIFLIACGLYILNLYYQSIIGVEEQDLIATGFIVLALLFLFGSGIFLIYSAIKMGIKKTSKNSK